MIVRIGDVMGMLRVGAWQKEPSEQTGISQTLQRR